MIFEAGESRASFLEEEILAVLALAREKNDDLYHSYQLKGVEGFGHPL